MYVLIVPASVPFVLLATVMGLSWWEDRILPAAPAEPVDPPAKAPFVPAAETRPFPQLLLRQGTVGDQPVSGSEGLHLRVRQDEDAGRVAAVDQIGDPSGVPASAGP
ncbi:hypothetical protein FBY34_2267 [Streptomyces sp. SLBN-115]|nr:hypothetical protein FBY34_2267 [Streptomyces sp. SLBN-115]